MKAQIMFGARKCFRAARRIHLAIDIDLCANAKCRRRRDILAHKPDSRNSSYKWLRKTGQVTQDSASARLRRIGVREFRGAIRAGALAHEGYYPNMLF